MWTERPDAAGICPAHPPNCAKIHSLANSIPKLQIYQLNYMATSKIMMHQIVMTVLLATHDILLQAVLRSLQGIKEWGYLHCNFRVYNALSCAAAIRVLETARVSHCPVCPCKRVTMLWQPA